MLMNAFSLNTCIYATVTTAVCIMVTGHVETWIGSTESQWKRAWEDDEQKCAAKMLQGKLGEISISNHREMQLQKEVDSG